VSIRIGRYIEPLSLASRREVPIIIESDAYRQVCTDLEMYVNGEILGRSFLVAGHRGVGKTTMLRQAVQEVDSRIRRKGEGIGQWARPLFIALHGPDLLEKAPIQAGAGDDVQKGDGSDAEAKNAAAGKPAEEAAAEKAAAARPSGGSAAPPKPPPPGDLFHFLDRITSGLYVGAAEEFSRCFREHATRVASSERERSELLELATDLQVQLDRQPDLDRLREYWTRVRALDGGVLFEGARDAGRGAAEVTALFSIGRAMRTFTGKVDSTLVTEANRRREGSVNLVTIDGQNLLPPLLGLASGALVWTSLPDGGSPLVKSFMALLTGLGAILALKVTSTRSRFTTQTWKETFIPKDDPGSLYRVLPGLIERFQRVGLFPVFVVDELDKVPGLGNKINALLGYMKQFVTERAFFCFVTDRSFYQQANAQLVGGAYSTLHTRFGDSIFVRYRARDFHSYLTEMISVDSPGMSQAEIDMAHDACEMLRYVLVSQSYLHPYDLRHELAQWQDGDGMLLRTVEDLLNSQRIQRDVAVQVAVEVVYEGPALREHVRDSITAQIVLDALYYPARKWREGVNELDITQKALTDYLVSRTGIQEEVAAGEKDVPADTLIPPALQKTLVDQVERLMTLLCDPKTLVVEASAAGLSLPPAVQRMLGTLDPVVDRL
jgi:hypothetical protein